MSKTIVYRGAVYREVMTRIAAVPAGVQAPEDELDARLYALAETMVHSCVGTPYERGMQGPRWCVYLDKEKKRFYGAFDSEKEAFQNAYMWLTRKYYLGRE